MKIIKNKKFSLIKKIFFFYLPDSEKCKQKKIFVGKFSKLCIQNIANYTFMYFLLLRILCISQHLHFHLSSSLFSLYSSSFISRFVQQKNSYFAIVKVKREFNALSHFYIVYLSQNFKLHFDKSKKKKNKKKQNAYCD